MTHLSTASISGNPATVWRDASGNELEVVECQNNNAFAVRNSLVPSVGEQPSDLACCQGHVIPDLFGSGVPSIKLMRALDMLRDAKPKPGPAIASAKSICF